MQRKISRVLGSGIVTLLVSSFLSVTPVSADGGSWLAHSIPDTKDVILGLSGIDVRDTAKTPGSTIIYVVAGESIPDNVIYKSINASLSWMSLDTTIQADLVVVAQDEPRMVVTAGSDTPVVTTPTSLPQDIAISASPLATPEPAVPDCLPTAIFVGAILLLAVIVLIIKPFKDLPPRVAKGISRVWEKFRECMVIHFCYFELLRTLRNVKSRLIGSDVENISRPISFAARSFLWMIAEEGKGESQNLLSPEEEQKLGKILALRIKAIARHEPLYQRYPEDAAIFLHLWSQYGSRYETNYYLTKSFEVRPDNVIRLLKCYLSTLEGQDSDLPHQTEFDQTLYDSVAKVVDPEKVYEALTKLYGIDLNKSSDDILGNSLNKIIALQFTRIHRQIKHDTAGASETAKRSKTGIANVR